MSKKRSKARTEASKLKPEKDPLDITDEIVFKEEKIDEIKNEVVDLDVGNIPASDIQLEIKKEVTEFPINNFINPKDIPGIEKIVNIEDILKSNLNSIDSTNLLSSQHANSTLQKSEAAFQENLSVSRKKISRCKCMQHVRHFCSTCNIVILYKTDETECPACKTILKLKCSKCRKKYKMLSRNHQYLLQYTRDLNLLTNEKKEITLKCQKQVTFHCSICLFNTKNKNKFNQHVKTHKVNEKFKQNEHSKVDTYDNADDEFIEIYCKKCCKAKKNLSFKNNEKYGCEECHEIMFYRCLFCEKLYKLLSHIRPHIRSKCLQRIEYFKFHCDHCYYKVADKSKLELHIRLVHTPVTCEYCKKEYVNSGALKQHKTKGCPVEKAKKICKRKTELPKLELQHCKDVTYSKSVYKKDSYQIVQYHPNELYNEICSRPPKDLYYSSWQSMIGYYCLLCDGQSNNKFSKYRPWCSHCNIKYEYKCKICEKLYGSYSNVCKHVQSECPARYSLVCSKCDFTSTQKQTLISHIKNKHTVYKCLQCMSRYHGYLSLRKHLLSNCKTTDLPIEKHVQKLIALFCKQCSERVINFEGSSCKQCIKCSSIMNYNCLKCNQQFNDLETVHKHIKNFCDLQLHCSECNYKAYTQDELDTHMKYVHTNRKCPDCGIEFKDERIFKKHRLEELRQKEEKKLL